MQGAERHQKEDIEDINNCIALRQRQGAKLASWLTATRKLGPDR
jgi:hypothetical protein